MIKDLNHPSELQTGTGRIVAGKELRGSYVGELKQQCATLMATTKEPVILDLSVTTAIDSQGIALCVGLYKECQKRKLPFTIEASVELLRFFKMLKLDRMFQCIEKTGGV
jgi:anti-anti-sigma factor